MINWQVSATHDDTFLQQTWCNIPCHSTNTNVTYIFQTFPAETLYELVSCIQMYLSGLDRPDSRILDQECKDFSEFNQTLTERMQELSDSGQTREGRKVNHIPQTQFCFSQSFKLLLGPLFSLLVHTCVKENWNSMKVGKYRKFYNKRTCPNKGTP